MKGRPPTPSASPVERPWRDEDGAERLSAVETPRARDLRVPRYPSSVEPSRQTYLQVEDVAGLLGCSKRTVHERARLGQIPHRRPPSARRLLFVESEIRAWLDGAQLEMVQLPRGGRVVRPRVESGACYPPAFLCAMTPEGGSPLAPWAETYLRHAKHLHAPDHARCERVQRHQGLGARSRRLCS
jgi:predicted DNA-binding transcriptional regulator AlpA